MGSNGHVDCLSCLSLERLLTRSIAVGYTDAAELTTISDCAFLDYGMGSIIARDLPTTRCEQLPLMCTYLAISTVSPSIVQCSIVPMATIQGGAPSDLAEGAQGAGTKRSYSELMNAVKTVVHTISKVISQPLKGTSSELGGGKEAVSSAATAAAADILQEAFPQTDSGASMVAAIAVSAATSSGNPNPNPIEKEAAATAKAATEPVSKPPSASMLRASIVQTYMPDFTMPIKLVVKYDPFLPNRSNAQVDLGIIFADNYFGEVFGLTLEEQNFHMAYCFPGPGCSLNVAQKKMINFSQITGKVRDFLFSPFSSKICPSLTLSSSVDDRLRRYLPPQRRNPPNGPFPGFCEPAPNKQEGWHECAPVPYPLHAYPWLCCL